MTLILFVKITLSVSHYSAHTPVESIISSKTISSFLPLFLYSIFSIYFLHYPQPISSTIYLSNFSSDPITLSLYSSHALLCLPPNLSSSRPTTGSHLQTIHYSYSFSHITVNLFAFTSLIILYSPFSFPSFVGPYRRCQFC